MKYNSLKNLRIIPKFGINQNVYALHSQVMNYLTISNTCSVCNGKCTVEYNGNNINCPKCKGKGIETFRDMNVSFWRHNINNECRRVTGVNLYINGVKNDIKYNLTPNYLFSEDTIFKTFDETVAACKQLNWKREKEERTEYGEKYSEECVPVINYNIEPDYSDYKEYEVFFIKQDIISCKYDLGERLYYVDVEETKRNIPSYCSVCKCTGKITLKNQTYDCPECKSKLASDMCVKVANFKNFILKNIHVSIAIKSSDAVWRHDKVLNTLGDHSITCKCWCSENSSFQISENGCYRNPLIPLKKIEECNTKSIEEVKNKIQNDLSEEFDKLHSNIIKELRETTLNDFNIAFMNTANRDNIDYYLEVYGLTELPESLQSIGGMADDYCTDVSNLTPEIFLMDLSEVEKKRLEDIISKARKDFIKGNPSFDETSLFN